MAKYRAFKESYGVNGKTLLPVVPPLEDRLDLYSTATEINHEER